MMKRVGWLLLMLTVFAAVLGPQGVRAEEADEGGGAGAAAEAAARAEAATAADAAPGAGDDTSAQTCDATALKETTDALAEKAAALLSVSAELDSALQSKLELEKAKEEAEAKLKELSSNSSTQLGEVKSEVEACTSKAAQTETELKKALEGKTSELAKAEKKVQDLEKERKAKTAKESSTSSSRQKEMSMAYIFDDIALYSTQLKDRAVVRAKNSHVVEKVRKVTDPVWETVGPKIMPVIAAAGPTVKQGAQLMVSKGQEGYQAAKPVVKEWAKTTNQAYKQSYKEAEKQMVALVEGTALEGYGKRIVKYTSYVLLSVCLVFLCLFVVRPLFYLALNLLVSAIKAVGFLVFLPFRVCWAILSCPCRKRGAGPPKVSKGKKNV